MSRVFVYDTTLRDGSQGEGVNFSLQDKLLLTRRLEPINWRNLRHAPWWSFLGGLVGSGYVLSSVYLTAALGTGLAISLIITVQTITSLTVDHFGLLGFPRRPLTRPRIAAALLMLIAVTLQVPR